MGARPLRSLNISKIKSNVSGPARWKLHFTFLERRKVGNSEDEVTGNLLTEQLKGSQKRLPAPKASLLIEEKAQRLGAGRKPAFVRKAYCDSIMNVTLHCI